MKITGFVAAGNGLMLFQANSTPHLISDADYDVQKVVLEITRQIAEKKCAEIELPSFEIKKVLKEAGIEIEQDEAGNVKLKSGVAEIDAGKKLNKQLNEVANGSRSAKGLKNFMRLFDKGKVKHSMEELLTFIERSDLPIADDGAIIGYKILCHAPKISDNEDVKDLYVDPHTKSVRQKLGSVVFMPASKVNDDRRTACGTGLHVCSYGYIRGFSGDVLTLVKVRPHDVIAVPHSEEKMRVCAYQIVALIPDAITIRIRNGGKLTDIPEGQLILQNVIAGNHPTISSKVEVGTSGAHKILEVPSNPKVKNRKLKAIKPLPKSEGVTRVTLNIKALKSQIADILKVKSSRRTSAQAAVIDYDRKFKQAKKLITDGLSLRDVAKKMNMDRNKLSDWIKVGR